MGLADQTKALIAVGASIGANCQPCLQSTMALARQCGAGEEQIAEAIRVGQKVRRGAALKMDEFALGLNDALPLLATIAQEPCGCG
jgi:AhpD family alkylhydroperoxidase